MPKTSRRWIESLVMAVVLAFFAGYALISLVGAAFTGAISTRGSGVILLSETPEKFWFTIAVFAAVVVFAGYGSTIFWRDGVAPNRSLKRTNQSLRD